MLRKVSVSKRRLFIAAFVPQRRLWLLKRRMRAANMEWRLPAIEMELPETPASEAQAEDQSLRRRLPRAKIDEEQSSDARPVSTRSQPWLSLTVPQPSQPCLLQLSQAWHEKSCCKDACFKPRNPCDEQRWLHSVRTVEEKRCCREPRQ